MEEEINNKKQYYLVFENDKTQLKKFYTYELENMLKLIKGLDKIKMVFINACHSFEFGKIFRDHGIPIVIAIKSNYKIDDEIAKKFSIQLYQNIFVGIDYPFKASISTIIFQEKDNKWFYCCCCNHSHKSDCEWFKFMKKWGV